MIVAHFEPLKTINASTGKAVIRDRSMVVPILGGHFFDPCYCEIIAACLRVKGELPIRIETKNENSQNNPDSTTRRELGRIVYPVKYDGVCVVRTSKPNLKGL